MSAETTLHTVRSGARESPATAGVASTETAPGTADYEGVDVADDTRSPASCERRKAH